MGTPYRFPNLHPGPCSSVGTRRGTDRQTHRQPWPIYIWPRLRLTRNVTSRCILSECYIISLVTLAVLRTTSFRGILLDDGVTPQACHAALLLLLLLLLMMMMVIIDMRRRTLERRAASGLSVLIFVALTSPQRRVPCSHVHAYIFHANHCQSTEKNAQHTKSWRCFLQNRLA